MLKLKSPLLRECRMKSGGPCGIQDISERREVLGLLHSSLFNQTTLWHLSQMGSEDNSAVNSWLLEAFTVNTIGRCTSLVPCRFNHGETTGEYHQYVSDQG